jgi:hypothetical protein
MMLWWAGLVLELVILGRMLRTRTFKTYPVFYFYMASVFAISGGLYLLYRAFPNNTALYGRWYWRTQLSTLVIGYGVIMDLSRKALAAYPGAERFVRATGLVIFATVFFVVGSHQIVAHSWSLDVLTADLERYLRVVEALFLATILAVLSYYRIAIGRNLAGLLLGMGIYVGVSVITLALLQFVGPRFESSWKLLQSSSYLFALAVWTAAFWSYSPDPPPDTPNVPSSDYQALAGHTREKLEALRSHLPRTGQP